MRYKPDEPRYDDPNAVMKHANRYKGGKALIVLGGYSAGDWENLYDEVNPDVLIGANGTNSMINGLDYWLCGENMKRADGLAKRGDKNSIALMEMFHRNANARNKMISHWSWELLKDTSNCYKTRRQGLELNEMDGFSFREYGDGLLAGWFLKHKEAGAVVHVGTIGSQALHLAGILGCSEVHTIGFDLMFRDRERHHAYDYPLYQVDKFRTNEMFVTYMGVPTQWVWAETSQWLKEIEPLFVRDGIMWKDHSNGLLGIEGVAL